MSDTRIAEIAPDLFQIHTPLPVAIGGFSFNQYLLRDDEPLLFHTGPGALYPQVSAAIARVLPLERLRWISFGHVESDECGALRRFLDAAPQAKPLCGRIAAMVSGGDLGEREPRALADDEPMSLGRHTIRWLDAPHVPHGWDNGFLFEETTRTLLAGDLFTQPGADNPPLTEGDVLGPSEALRAKLPYFSLGPNTPAVIERLAALQPALLTCMHGSAWRGDGARLLRELAGVLRS